MNGLLADADLIQFIAMVVVLSLVAISTWIRKTIEKAQQGKGKGPIDVGKAVREQLDKYMRAAGQLPPKAPPAPEPTPVPETPVRATRRLVTPEPMAATVLRPTPKEGRRLVTRPTPKKVKHLSKFSPQDVKRAIVQAEILGPPIALRKDYRLF